MVVSLFLKICAQSRRGDGCDSALWKIDQAAEYKALAFARYGIDNDEFCLEDVNRRVCRVRLQFPEHPVTALSTGLVVSARGVPTYESEVRVQRQNVSFPWWAASSFISSACLWR